MKKFVLDTSVIVKWFSKDEDDVTHANKLRSQILEGLCDITIPDLLFYELANALRHNPNFTAKDVQSSLDSVFDMEFDVRKVTSSVITAAINIAFKFNVTVYDAYFLALSQLENKPFVTADYKFIGRIKGFKGIVNLTEI
jgi:predicted nucleic acid-binding protein